MLRRAVVAPRSRLGRAATTATQLCALPRCSNSTNTSSAISPKLFASRAFVSASSGALKLTSHDFASQVSQILRSDSQQQLAQHKLKQIQVLRNELDALTVRKASIDNACERAPDMMARLGLLYLVSQSVLLYYWVYYRFDWCLCEPITYLLGTAVGWIGLGFYLLTGADYDWDVLRNLMIERARKSAYVSEKLDIRRIHELKEEIRLLEKEIDEHHHE